MPGRDPREREIYVGSGAENCTRGDTLDRSIRLPGRRARGVGRRVAAAAPARRARRRGARAFSPSQSSPISTGSRPIRWRATPSPLAREGERQRRRRDLVALLVRDPPGGRPTAPGRAGGRLGRRAPRRCSLARRPSWPAWRAACRPKRLRRRSTAPGRRLVPDPAGPGRGGGDRRRGQGRGGRTRPGARSEGRSAPRGRSPSAALRAARGGRRTRGPAGRGRQPGLVTLLLLERRDLVQRIAERRLAPLRGLRPEGPTGAMEETALAYVRHRGDAAAMARALHVHAQTDALPGGDACGSCSGTRWMIRMRGWSSSWRSARACRASG